MTRDEPIEPAEKRSLQNYQNLLLNGKPLDQHHMGYKKLRPKDQEVYSRLNACHQKGKSLSPDEQEKLEKLAGAIQLNCGPYNQKHEGVNNLVPSEQETLQELLNKQASRRPLDDEEKKELIKLKDTMRPEVDYDNLHPGYDSLMPQD